MLNNYFLNPEGLIAASALIPLAILYLVKKDPEKHIMPSIMFFQGDKESKSTSWAIKIFSRNILLLLHILMITVFALAFAEPFMEGQGSSENAILILDRSGSMGDLEESKNFLKQRAGEENTVITVDNDARVVAEQVSASEAEQAIEKVKPAETQTDIVSGFEAIRGYPGDVYVASDLDQTSDDRDFEAVLESLESTDRGFEVLETERRNLHGIIEAEASRDSIRVEVKNFADSTRNIQIEKDNTSKNLEIDGKSVKSAEFEATEGKNTLELEEDDFRTDNQVSLFIPREAKTEVSYISGERNSYISKVFELVNSTSFEYSTPEDVENSDIYIVDGQADLEEEEADMIQEDVRNGSNLVIMGSKGFSDLDLDELPVEDQGSTVNTTVSINQPIQTALGEMEIREVEHSGERYSGGSNAVVKTEYGAGELLLYNIQDSNFRNSFLYPVFWKKIAEDMTDKTTVEESNMKTGDTVRRDRIRTPDGEKRSGRYELSQQGFYQTSRGTIAANMLSERESLRDTPTIELTQETDDRTENSIQSHLIALILILIITELAYLYRIGDLR